MNPEFQAPPDGAELSAISRRIATMLTLDRLLLRLPRTLLIPLGHLGLTGGEPLVEGSPVRVSPDCTVKDVPGLQLVDGS